MNELLAFRIAQNLGDAVSAAHYCSLLSEHSPERFLAAYRRTMRAPGTSDLPNRFHAELQQANGRMDFSDDIQLIAVKVERRSIAAAVFEGTHLEHTDIRHLSSNERRAENSAVEFINRITSTFNVESAALEALPTGTRIRRTVLSKAIVNACIQSQGVALWQFPKKQLFEAFGYPALRSRKELRDVIFSMWPVLHDSPRVDQALDAVALGALVQVERLFLH